MKLNKIRKWGLPLAVITLIAITVSSCTKYDDPAAVYEEYGEEVEFIQRKVLLISIDGAVGAEVKKAMPINIAKLLKTSKYTWTGLSESFTYDASTWKSMVTGVSSTKHMVLDESDDFLATPDINDPHSVPQLYPSVFYRMMEARAQDETVIITPWPELANRLMIEADTRIVVANDAAVRDAAIVQLKDEDPELMIVNFRSVIDAGVASGFTIENGAYLGALNRVDEHIGEIMEALKKRKKYEKEEWLVIITSNHGGNGTTYGGESLDERNIFSIFHYPDFLSTELTAEYLNTVRFHGTPAAGMVRARARDVDGTYNPGTGSMTIETKIKRNRNSSGNFSYTVAPPFLSKAASRAGGVPGWTFMHFGGRPRFFVSNGSENIELAAPNDEDGLWHSLAGVIDRNPSGSMIKLYMDGRLVDERAMNTTGAINSSVQDLVMGFWADPFGSGNLDLNMADVRIWNTALTAEQIKENACLMDIPSNHPQIAHLVGNWPAQDGNNTFANLLPGKPNFTLEGAYKYGVSTVTLPCGEDPANVLVQNVDLVPQIFYWLKIKPKADWSLDGAVFLDRFEIEFIKPQGTNLQ